MRDANRQFDISDAVRSHVPVLVGLVGPSGCGKTFSGLRLATGIQRVVGGDIHVIDTESRRALHYTDQFRFKHLAFAPPFSPLDYLAAIEACVKAGAKTIMIDSMSHEHEGPGGVLEMHDAEVQRMGGGDWKKAQKVTMAAWIKPKAERRRLINSILQLGVNLICCWRAQQKLRLVQGKEPEARGWQAIGAEAWTYEMTASLLLYPGCDGVPALHPEHADERAAIKIPIQWRGQFFARQLSEEVGQEMARWAAGVNDKPSGLTLRGMLEALSAASSADKVAELKDQARDMYRALRPDEKTGLINAIKAAEAALAEPPSPQDGPSLNQLINVAQLAKDADGLDEVEDMARSLPAGDRDAVLAVVDGRRKEI